MARYGTQASKGVANVRNILALNAAAANMRRIRIYEWKMGCDNAVLVDQQFVHQAQRITTVPTGAALVPNALDPADTIASTAQATGTTTVDPTFTANAFLEGVGLNMRNSMRWLAYDRAAEMIVPAVANAGIGLALSAVSLFSFTADANWDE